MTRNRNKRTPARIAAKDAQMTGDSFQNFASRVGLGTQNQNSASGYGFSPISRNRVQLEFCYRSSWIAGKAVDAYAEDMTREGIEFKGIDPEDAELLQKAETRLQIWNSLCDTIKWSRLYGGSIAVLMIDGQDLKTPLNLDSVGEGQFKGLLVLDRWMAYPTLTDLVTEMGPDIGKPMFYDVVQDAMALPNMRIHYSRVIRMEGVKLPYWQRISENLWGQSVLERLWDRLIPFDSATQGAAQLVYKAHLRNYKVKGLREIIAAGGKAMEGLTKQIDMIRQFQSNEGMTLMDLEDEFEANTYAFTGLPEIILQFGQQIAGATDIPMVRFFGQAPVGMNATGESDFRQYYDGISAAQERDLRSGVAKVLSVMHRSELGVEPDKNFDFDFRSLWQMDEMQKSDIATKATTAILGAYDSQVIDRATALQELRHSAEVTGIFTTISDELIEEAKNDPPPAPDESMSNENPDAGSKEES